jgi:hypothetical protein
MFGNVAGPSMNSLMGIQNQVPTFNTSLAQQAYNGYQQGMTFGQNQSMLAQQQYARNQANMLGAQQIVKWAFNGKICTVRQMADEIWHEDCPEKTHFILKYE